MDAIARIRRDNIMTDITEAELLQAIEEALATGSGATGLEPGTMTSPRLAEHLGISKKKAQKILTGMWRDGKVKPDKVQYTDPWGYAQRIKGWRVVTVISKMETTEKPGG